VRVRERFLIALNFPTYFPLTRRNTMTEVCNECGQPVHAESGKYVNRVIDFSGYKTRKAMGKTYPEGDYICAECETDFDGQQPSNVLPFPARAEEERK
jgi:hypothetical protein